MINHEAKESNQTGLDKTLVDLFFSQAQAAPQRLFCQYQPSGSTWDTMSYDAARHHVVSLAAGFSGLGLKPGDGLAIMAKTRWEWVALELAALRVGGVVTGLEPHGSMDDILFRLMHSGVRALAIEANEVARLPESALKLLDFLILLDGSATIPTAGPVVVTFDQLETMGKNNSSHHFPWPSPEDKAALLYTSGTTGSPKAILYRHRQVMASVRAVENALPNVGPNDSVLCWLPLAHLFQRMINYVAISRGAPMAFLGDPRHVLDTAKKIRPTILLGVPRFFEKLHQGMEEGLERLPRWVCSLLGPTLIYPRLRRVLGGKVRLMITGSAPTPLAHLSFFQKLGLPLYEAYGVSENTVPISMNLPHAVRLGSVGRPLKENQVRLTPQGEICVRGPGVCEGYWKSETDLPLDAEGYYHTGDLGRQDAQGFLYVLGRRDDMFKTSTGRKISPTRLETVYGQSPLFDRVMAVGRGRPFPSLIIWLKTSFAGAPEKGGERLLTPAQRERIRQEIDRLGAGLLSYERAGSFLVVAAPPDIASGTLTPSLKLRRSVLEDRWATRIDALYENGMDRVSSTISQRGGSGGSKKRGDRAKILFVPEGVALSHPARLFQLARQLDPETYEIHMAVDPRYRRVLGPTAFYMHDMVSLSSATFDRRVGRGGVVYTEEDLEKFVQQELALFDLVQPDIVVGDWRPSLGISAQIAGATLHQYSERVLEPRGQGPPCRS
ncbi:MAG: AMP-binding protein [Elusimicrobia bacterium]|nr:AMP-binding protein [Elusimicrobiota bacterium]